MAVVVSPEGNRIVVKDADVQGWLDKGYITDAVYQAQQAQIAEQKRQEWLASPDTVEERFSMLRVARDGKIAKTDYLMASDYPIDDGVRSQVAAYRQALRDLPAQEGAPWDGGGELTPWPAAPAI